MLLLCYGYKVNCSYQDESWYKEERVWWKIFSKYWERRKGKGLGGIKENCGGTGPKGDGKKAADRKWDGDTKDNISITLEFTLIK